MWGCREHFSGSRNAWNLPFSLIIFLSLFPHSLPLQNHAWRRCNGGKCRMVAQAASTGKGAWKLMTFVKADGKMERRMVRCGGMGVARYGGIWGRSCLMKQWQSLRSMAFIPAETDLHLSVNIAQVRIVAPVFPSPATSLVAFATCFYKTGTNILDLVLEFNALSNSYSIW